MNIALWVVQTILAVAFLMAGGLKVARGPVGMKEKGGHRMDWVDDLTEPQVRAIGAVEVLGGIGVVLPAAVDIAPVLTPLAAGGLALTMLGALAFHVRRGDGVESLVPNVVLGGMAVFVTIQRFGPQAF